MQTICLGLEGVIRQKTASDFKITDKFPAWSVEWEAKVSRKVVDAVFQTAMLTDRHLDQRQFC